MSDNAPPSAAERYAELNSTGRHYDQKLWLIPGAAIALSALITSATFEKDRSLHGGLVLSLINAIMFSAFLLQFVKDRCFQLANQESLDQLDDHHAFSADLPVHPQDRWFIRLGKKYIRAANYMFYVMLLVLLLQVVVASCFLVAVCRVMWLTNG